MSNYELCKKYVEFMTDYEYQKYTYFEDYVNITYEEFSKFDNFMNDKYSYSWNDVACKYYINFIDYIRKKIEGG